MSGLKLASIVLLAVISVFILFALIALVFTVLPTVAKILLIGFVLVCAIAYGLNK